MGWYLRILEERFGKNCIWVHGIDEHLKRHVFLKLVAQHEVYKLFGDAAILRPFEDADKLDLAEAGVWSQNGRGGLIIQRCLVEDYFRGGRGGV